MPFGVVSGVGRGTGVLTCMLRGVGATTRRNVIASRDDAGPAVGQVGLNTRRSPRSDRQTGASSPGESVRLEVIAKLHFRAPRFSRDLARIAEHRPSGPMAALLR